MLVTVTRRSPVTGLGWVGHNAGHPPAHTAAVRRQPLQAVQLPVHCLHISSPWSHNLRALPTEFRDFLSVWEKIPFCGIFTDPAGSPWISLYWQYTFTRVLLTWGRHGSDRADVSSLSLSDKPAFRAFVTDLLGWQNVTAQKHSPAVVRVIFRMHTYTNVVRDVTLYRCVSGSQRLEGTRCLRNVGNHQPT